MGSGVLVSLYIPFTVSDGVRSTLSFASVFMGVRCGLWVVLLVVFVRIGRGMEVVVVGPWLDFRDVL